MHLSLVLVFQLSASIGNAWAFSFPHTGFGLLNRLDRQPTTSRLVTSLAVPSRAIYMSAARASNVARLLPSYQAVGRKLMESGHYQGLIDGILDCSSCKGFIMIDSPSGSGKSQAGVALKYLDYTRPDSLANCSSVNLKGAKLRVVHLVWDHAVNDQPVYGEIVLEAKNEGVYNGRFFASCRRFGTANRRHKDMFSVDDEEEVWEAVLQPIFEKNKISNFDVEIFREKHKLDGAILVLFVDEFPKRPTDVQDMLVVREALRPFSDQVVLVLAGTSAKASNVESLTVGYLSSFDYVSRPWSLLVTRLPTFQMEFSPSIKQQWDTTMAKLQQDQDPDLQAIVSLISVSLQNGGNPRLIVFAVAAISSVLTAPLGSLWTAWQSAFSELVTNNKFTVPVSDSWFDASGGLRAQLNLLCAASSRAELSDVMLSSHFAHRAVPDGGRFSGTNENATLSNCGGWLYIAEPTQRIYGRRLQFVPGPRVQSVSGNHEWETTVFAPFEQDPLLYVGCCRKGGFFTVTTTSVNARLDLPAHEVVLNLWVSNSAGWVNFQNPYALSNTGSMLEVASTVASCNAAAVGSNTQSSLPLCKFFGNLMVELGLPIDSNYGARLLQKDASFCDIYVPRCVFPGTTLPADLSGRIALILRLPNSNQYDWAMCGLLGRISKICGEAKDRFEFGTKELSKSIFKLSNESEIGFLVLRGCNKYWTKAGDDNHNLIVEKNLEALKEALNTPMQKENKKTHEITAIHCTVGKIHFFSGSGAYAKLDLENGEKGRIVLIQVPSEVLGYDINAEASGETPV